MLERRSLSHQPLAPEMGTSLTQKPMEPVSIAARRTRLRRGRGRSRGFTLIELLITMAIIVTIAAMAIPSLMTSINLAKIARSVGDIDTLEDEIALYQSINGVLPDDLSQVGYGGFLDPWGNPYEYLNHTNMKGNGKARKDRFLVPLNSDYDLYSDGQDGASVSPLTAKPSQDDIIRAGNGSYVGLASNF
jgi:general secretion pathway protein G